MRVKITDMTDGSPSRHILVFSLPLLVGNLFQQLYNMVDSVIVGNFVGPNALAAVGTCGSMNFLFFALSSGLAIGIGIIVSQYFGARNDGKLRSTIANSVYVLTSVALVISVAGFFVSPLILRLLNCPDIIFADAVSYARTICFGIIFVVYYNGVSSVLRALGDSRTPLYFLIFSSIINLVLDILFVLKFGWGVNGVAVATVISQAASAVSSLLYAVKKVEYFRLSRAEMSPDMHIISGSFRLGVPIALQSSMIAVSMMILQGVVNTFGETVMASYTIGMRIEQLVQQPYSSLGAAITTYSGQNIGAGDLGRVKKGFWSGTLMALVFSLAVIPVFQLLAPQIVRIFVKDAQVISIGSTGLRICSWFYFLLGMIYVPRAVLNGCGDTGFAMINGLTEVAGRIAFSQVLTRLAFVSLFGHKIPLGFWGIWLTTGLTWTLTAVICIIRYRSGVWKRKAVFTRN